MKRIQEKHIVNVYRGSAVSASTPNTGGAKKITIFLSIVALVVSTTFFVRALNNQFVLVPEQVVAQAAQAVDVEVVEIPRSYRQSCHANIIVAESLAACITHPKCQLSIDETAIMYRAGKDAIIDCKRAEMIEEFVEKLQPEPEPYFQQPEPDDGKVITI